jgi:exopolyphosphatase/guanosine-5'-triphosphate,3'-diphosphate pyrophosphatase
LNRYATIDIGTNTILLLVGTVTPQRTLQVVLDIEETTRLGRGLQKRGVLDPQGVRKSITVLKRFVSICHREGVKELVAIGTNPLRVAADTKEFIQLVKKECGISVRVIAAKEEAYLSFLAAQRDPLIPRNALVLDVGGGSTEYIFRQEGNPLHLLETISLPMGAVNLTEKFLSTDPPFYSELTKLQREIKKNLNRLPPSIEEEVVGIGGTAVTLGSIYLGLEEFNREKIHGLRLSIDDISTQVRELQSKDITDRKKIRGLPQDRADIILAGAMIILLSMERLERDVLYISCHGLRYGLFYQRFLS